MAYPRQQGVDTCDRAHLQLDPADEQVLYDDGRELRRETVERARGAGSPRAPCAGYVPRAVAARTRCSTGVPPRRVPARRLSRCPRSPMAGGSRGRATALIAHPTDERCFEVTHALRTLDQVTGDHSVFVEGLDGEPEPEAGRGARGRRADRDRRRIDVPERDRTVGEHARGLALRRAGPVGPLRRGAGLGELAWAAPADLFGLLVSRAAQRGTELAQRGLDEADPHAADRSRAAAGVAGGSPRPCPRAPAFASATPGGASRCPRGSRSATTCSGCSASRSPRDACTSSGNGALRHAQLRAGRRSTARP